MTVTFKTFYEILAQMQTTVDGLQGDDGVDLNIGRIVRSVLEACAIQDADQYVQIAKLLKVFSLWDCKGDDVDRRLLELGARFFPDMRRQETLSSVVKILVGDGTLAVQTQLVADYVAGVVSFDVTAGEGALFAVSGAVVVERNTSREETLVFTRLVDTFTVVSPVSGSVYAHPVNSVVEFVATKSILAAAVGVGAGVATLLAGTESAWPASGSVIFERSTTRRELLPFTRVGVTLTLTGVTTYAHAVDTDVYLSTHGSDRAIAADSAPYVQATVSSRQIDFLTVAEAVLLDGDTVSGLLEARSTQVGADTRTGSNTITKWTSPPFANATVTNPFAAVGGRDRESDNAVVARAGAFIQSLSRGTSLALEELVIGQVDPDTGLRVLFAQSVEPVAPGEGLLYISDGSTTFSIDYQVKSGRDVLISIARTNDVRSRLHNLGPFKVTSTPAASITPRVFKSSHRGSATLVGANFLEDSSQSWTPAALVGFYLKTDDDQFFLITANTAIRLTVTAFGSVPSLGSFCVFDFTVDPLVPGTDYTFNRSKGELELTTPLVENDGLVAADDGAAASIGAYTYSQGLAAFAQRLVNGDKDDRQNYPGIKSHGSQILVAIPTIVTPAFVIQVLGVAGVTDDDLRADVQAVVQTYVNSLGMGDKIVYSKAGAAVQNLAVVDSSRILSPAGDVTTLAGQLPRITASDVTVV